MSTNGTQITGDLLEVPSGVARLRYFYGQLLTQRDLQAEQRYHLLLQRLLQREALGTGTVAGLRIDPAALPVQECVVVRAGLALDPEGRELVLPNDVSVKIAEAVKTPSTAAPYVTGTPDYAAATVATQVRTFWGASFGASDVADLSARLKAAGLTGTLSDGPGDTYPFTAAQLNKLALPAIEGVFTAAQLNKLALPASFSLPPGQTLLEYLEGALVGTTYLGLRYLERGREPSPAVLDGSCCGEAACFPARLEEGVMIVATPFAPVKDPYQDAREWMSARMADAENPPGAVYPGHVTAPVIRGAFCEYLIGAFRGLPPSDDPCTSPEPPVVPLALAYWSRFARETSGTSRILSIDNGSLRPLAPGVPAVRALFEEVTQLAPQVYVPPHIDLISPADHTALANYISGGTEAYLRARVTCRLDSSTLPSTWQITFYPASASIPFVWDSTHSPSPTYPFTITVNYNHPNFDLMLTSTGGALALPAGVYVWRLSPPTYGTIPALKSSAVLDGEPNPPAVAPTGDGVQGGTFTATFYVP
jgi:hypothetical protein